jgi:hypothetical protein
MLASYCICENFWSHAFSPSTSRLISTRYAPNTPAACFSGAHLPKWTWRPVRLHSTSVCSDAIASHRNVLDGPAWTELEPTSSECAFLQDSRASNSSPVGTKLWRCGRRHVRFFSPQPGFRTGASRVYTPLRWNASDITKRSGDETFIALPISLRSIRHREVVSRRIKVC